MSIARRNNTSFGFARGDGWIFVALVLAIVGIGEALRVFRAPALLLIALVAATYARESMFRRQNFPLLLFSVWGLIYVVLSFIDAFPAAWTRYYDRGAIFQQASFLAILLPLVSASQKWWEDARFDFNRDAVLIAIVLAAFLFGSVIDIIMFGTEGMIPRPLVTLRNFVFIGLLALTYLIFRSERWRSIAIGVFVVLTGWSIWWALYVQNVIAYATIFGFLTMAILRISADRLMLFLFVLLATIVTIVGILDPLPIFEIDPNTGWRLAWWGDVVEALRDTWGVGVGFGTESLRNEYSAILHRDSYRAELEDFLFVGTHSAFFDTMFRTGVVGFLLLCIVLVRCFPHPRMAPLARAHCCAMFALLILCLHSNLGLQSPMYSIGAAICIGYLQSERRRMVHSVRLPAFPWRHRPMRPRSAAGDA
ncbi:MAG: hypothetical protein IT539_14050 [Bradyrhizobiaceae bacterium]|nr:hypothetical protein [Bradyrhizobiaceae bacterium]